MALKVEIDAGSVYLEGVLGLRIALGSMIESVLVEYMSVLDGLYGVSTLGHAEFELTLEVALHPAAGLAHGQTIHQEGYTHNGDARTLIHNVARNLNTRGDGKVDPRRHIAGRTGIEHYRQSVAAVGAQVGLRE